MYLSHYHLRLWGHSLLTRSRQLIDQGLLQMGSDLCSQSGSVILREPFYLWWFVASRQALLGSSRSDPWLPFISWRLATRTLQTARCNDEPSSPGRFNQWPLRPEEGPSCPSLSTQLMKTYAAKPFWLLRKKTLFCPIFYLFQFTWWWELMRFWF